jgi:hypothetical protein
MRSFQNSEALADPTLADSDAQIESLLGIKVRVPQSIVYRSLATETVLLDIESGRYYGLNLSAGRMLETLDRVADVRQAAALLADEFDQPVVTLERDIAGFCADLLRKGLLQTDAHIEL